jgi:hypothetical protein
MSDIYDSSTNSKNFLDSYEKARLAIYEKLTGTTDISEIDSCVDRLDAIYASIQRVEAKKTIEDLDDYKDEIKVTLDDYIKSLSTNKIDLEALLKEYNQKLDNYQSVLNQIETKKDDLVSTIETKADDKIATIETTSINAIDALTLQKTQSLQAIQDSTNEALKIKDDTKAIAQSTKDELIKSNQEQLDNLQITQTENATKLDNNSLSDVIQKSMQHTISTLKNSESEYIDFSIIANKLRELIDSNNQLKQKSESISQILQSDDVNLDSLQEIVSFIKSNKDNIDATTIGGKSLDDIKNELLSNTSASGFDYESDNNPTTSTNPTKQSAKWLNTSTAELFVCTDNTTDNNIWRGSNNSLVKVMPYVGFETTLYTGNGTSQEIVSKSINSGVDFIWIKSRTTTDGNFFVDSLRGINNIIDVFWDLPHFSREQYVTNATNNSFTVGSDEDVNKAGASYVACMATLPNHNPSNTDGTITTESRSNSFMSIAKFLSTTNDNESVGHGLGTKPELTILKPYTSASRDWIVFGEVLGEGKYLSLNKTDSLTNRPNYYLPATDKVINLGPKDFAQISHTANFLLYSFVSVEGMCKIGTIDGPSATIETGFETQFLLIKNIDSTSDWFIIDNQRGTDKAMRTNSAKPEVVNPFGNPYAVTFKADSITLAEIDKNKYLYMAIAKGAM